MKKNVLVITHHTFTHKGSVMEGVTYLEEKMKKDGIRTVYLFTPSCKSIEWINKLDNVYFLSDSNKKNIFLIMEIVKKENIGIIHTHFVTPAILLLVKLISSISPGVKFVRHMHMLYTKKKNPLLNEMKKITGFGDITVACSQTCAKTLLDAGVKNVVTVTNATDFSSLHCEKKAHSGINILMFGYDYKNKGVDIAVGGVKKLNRTDVKLYICVTNGLEYVKENIKADYGEIPDFISFLPKTDKVGEYYGLCDIFLSSGSIESYCYAVREAVYCGCKVVATDIPAHYMDCGEIYFKSQSSDSLCEALKKSIDKDDSDALKYKEKIKNSTSIENWANSIYEIYNKL